MEINYSPKEYIIKKYHVEIQKKQKIISNIEEFFL